MGLDINTGSCVGMEVCGVRFGAINSSPPWSIPCSFDTVGRFTSRVPSYPFRLSLRGQWPDVLPLAATPATSAGVALGLTRASAAACVLPCPTQVRNVTRQPLTGSPTSNLSARPHATPRSTRRGGKWEVPRAANPATPAGVALGLTRASAAACVLPCQIQGLTVTRWPPTDWLMSTGWDRMLRRSLVSAWRFVG